MVLQAAARRYRWATSSPNAKTGSGCAASSGDGRGGGGSSNGSSSSGGAGSGDGSGSCGSGSGGSSSSTAMHISRILSAIDANKHLELMHIALVACTNQLKTMSTGYQQADKLRKQSQPAGLGEGAQPEQAALAGWWLTPMPLLIKLLHLTGQAAGTVCVTARQGIRGTGGYPWPAASCSLLAHSYDPAGLFLGA